MITRTYNLELTPNHFIPNQSHTLHLFAWASFFYVYNYCPTLSQFQYLKLTFLNTQFFQKEKVFLNKLNTVLIEVGF